MSKLLEWLDDRTGYRKVLDEALYERIPGGAKWRYVWGSTLVFTFTVQVITGLVLWSAYSPSSQTAWESVYFIQHEMVFGWFLRGLHHYTAQAMIVLLALHVVQVVAAGAYRAPREVNWWLGMLLLFVTLGLSLTGYLLPWDQKGYWATQVATNIMGGAPVLGPIMQRLLVGGPEYGHHTLTRFFALHAGLLPLLLGLLLVGHVAVFRRHGVTHPKNAAGETTFWPDQMLRDAIACLLVLVIIVVLIVRHGFGAHAGADLGAPADPASQYSAARPEWYFLFLFQLLKYFEGEREIIGSIVIPTAVVILLFLFPLIARVRIGHAFNVTATFALFGGIGWLTYAAITSDRNDPQYIKAVDQARENADRIAELASQGIPKTGAIDLLRSDPLTQGPRLFKENCASCHRWDGHDGMGSEVVEVVDGKTVPAAPSASDLHGFGTLEWIEAFLRNPADARFLGHTAHQEGDMATWAQDNTPLMNDREIAGAAAFLANQAGRTDAAPPDPELVEAGFEFFAIGNDAGAQACSDCHKFDHAGILHGEEVPSPDLTGYASEEWLTGIIAHAGDSKYFGERNDGMPEFRKQLRPEEIQLLVDWMRGQWPRPVQEAQEGP